MRKGLEERGLQRLEIESANLLRTGNLETLQRENQQL